MKVGVFGAAGRMGGEVCRAVAEEDTLDLACAVDPRLPGAALTVVLDNLKTGSTAETMAGVDVAVDFTVADQAMANARWCAANGVHAVIGTSGLTEADLNELRAAFTRSNCLVAPNFAIGAVLMIRFAELAAPFFETTEIIELHHDQKADAPSGTAVHTAERMAAASEEWAEDPTRIDNLPHARGAGGAAGIHIHSVRLRGLVAHQEVLLGTTGQTLTIRHDSYDRTSFMPGVLLGVKRVSAHPGVTVGLDTYLGL